MKNGTAPRKRGLQKKTAAPPPRNWNLLYTKRLGQRACRRFDNDVSRIPVTLMTPAYKDTV